MPRVWSKARPSKLREGQRATWLAALALAVSLSVAAALAFGVLSGRTATSQSQVQQSVAAGREGTVLIQTARLGRPSGVGSGWVLDAPGGLIVTAAHVLNSGETYSVTAGGHVDQADILGVSPCEDLALLRLRHPPAPGAALRPAEAAPEQGASVISLSFPAGAAFTAALGIVTVPRTTYADPSAELPALPSVLQTDAAVNPGSSGAPLVDLDGRVVGIDVASRATVNGRAIAGRSFAIAIAHALDVLEPLRRGVSTGWLGLTFGYPSAAELERQALAPGLTITGAVPGTPAAVSELPDRADQLLAVDGRPVGTTLAGYCRAIRDADRGDTVTLLVTAAGGAGRRTVALRLP